MDHEHDEEGKPRHPFRLWMDQRKMTYEDVADLCESRGYPTRKEYLSQICIGFRRPSWDLAKFLSERIAKGEVTAEQFMDFAPGGRVPPTDHD